MTAAFGADVAHGYNLVTSRTRDVTHDVSRVDRVRLILFASRLQHKSANDVESDHYLPTVILIVILIIIGFHHPLTLSL